MTVHRKSSTSNSMTQM